MTLSERWQFAKWIWLLLNDAEQAARDERLTGIPAYHDAITDNLLWKCEE